MKRTGIFLTAAFALGVIGGAAQGQDYIPQVAPQPGPRSGFGLAPGWGGFGWRASTLEEGVLRGQAALAEGVARGNYFNSLAAIAQQEAVAQARENRLKGIEAYYAARRIHAEQRLLSQNPRPTPAQLQAVAKAGLPAPLTAAQYEPRLGQLYWPAALTGEAFAKPRAALDLLFAGRTTTDSGAGSAFYRDVRRLTDQMHDELRNFQGDISQMEYVAAFKFLNSLAFEAQSAKSLQGHVAANR